MCINLCCKDTPNHLAEIFNKNVGLESKTSKEEINYFTIPAYGNASITFNVYN